MNLDDMAADLANRLRANRTASPNVVVGMQLTVAVWNAADPANSDTGRSWSVAAIGARSALDTIDPQAAGGTDTSTDASTGTKPGRRAAAAVTQLLAVIGAGFADATATTTAVALGEPRRHPAAWYLDAEQELQNAAGTRS